MDYAVLVFGLDFVLLDTMWQRNLSFSDKKALKYLVVSKIISTFALAKSERGVAQSGSAPGLGPGGRRFESCRPDIEERFSNKTENLFFAYILLLFLLYIVVISLLTTQNRIILCNFAYNVFYYASTIDITKTIDKQQ